MNQGHPANARPAQGPLRVAIVSHGHPELSRGGAENASYAQFLALKQRPDIDPVYVARCAPEALGHTGPFAAFRGRSDEILWSPPETDRFRLISSAPDVLQRQLVDLDAHITPDIVHLHHVAGFGADMCRLLPHRPGARTVLTLHEYLSICQNWGVMVKTSGQLCHQSSFSECSACFPAVSAGKFFLRKELLLQNFAHVDAFVAPSEFLRQRYVAWGLEADRVRTIENPLNVGAAHRPPVATASQDGTLRLGYFGQLTPFKGVDILLAAMSLLAPDIVRRVKLVLFGLDLPARTSSNAEQIGEWIERLRGSVINYGPYRNEDVTGLMRSVDWIVVPSIWWENSPVVIQEAKAAGVPILCSNIGGMREKVRPGVDGEHFSVGNPVDLADRIADIALGRLVVKPMADRPGTFSIDELVGCYYEILASPRSNGSTAGTQALGADGSDL